MFYAPWCGVCKSAKPSFYEAAELLGRVLTIYRLLAKKGLNSNNRGQKPMLADEDETTKFAIYNCDSDDPNDKLYSNQFGVQSYPTIYSFDEGEQKYKFSGHHNVDTFLRFGRDPKTKGREAKTDDDGNEISGWANNNGAQNIIEVQDRLLHLKSSLNRKLDRK